jgi:hypothetical protein
MEAKAWYWDWDSLAEISGGEILPKSEWGEGPWQQEPDQEQWPDEATGLPCLVRRNEWFGYLCGYVGVPKGHPWYRVYFPEVDADVDYSDFCHKGPEGHVICHVPEPGESDRVWWLGFNCGHITDVQPALDALLGLLGANNPHLAIRSFMHQSYKPVGFVKAECARLAAQIAAAV